MTTEYEAITEDEWKSLATTEITHLTDEEKDYLPAAWDEWIARVRREAKAEGWDEVHSWGWSDAQDAHDVRQEMDRADWPLNTPNPYRQEKTP